MPPRLQLRPDGRPMVPIPLAPLLALVQQYVQGCPMIGHFPVAHGATYPAMTGQCTNAATLFWYLAGGTAAGWKNMRLPGITNANGSPKRGNNGRLLPIRRAMWSEGPHAFLLHVPTGTVVDPTEGQYPPSVRIPYERAEGGTSGGFRRDDLGRTVPPPKILAAARALRADPRAPAAITAARAWAATRHATRRRP